MSEAVASSSLPAQEVGPLARIPGALFSPAKTFESIARRPTWLPPLLLWTAVSLSASFILGPRIDVEKAIRKMVERRGATLTDAQIVEMAQSRKPGPVGMLIRGGATPAIIALVIAVVIWGSFKAFGWDATFRQSFSVTTHGFLPGVLKAVLLIVVASRLDSIDALSMGDLVRSNLGFLVAGRSTALHVIAQSLDVFTLWTVTLLTVGFSKAARVSNGAAAGVIVTLWLVIVLAWAGIASLLF